MTDQLSFPALTRARQKSESKNQHRIAALVPVALQLAEKAGLHGVTVGDVRLAANIETGTDRRLSWLGAVMRQAKLVNTGKRRICAQSRTRNDQSIYIHPRFAR